MRETTKEAGKFAAGNNSGKESNYITDTLLQKKRVRTKQEIFVEQ
jgi:hypothetical protein